MLFHTMGILWYSVWLAWNHIKLWSFFDLDVTVDLYGTFYDFIVCIDHHIWLAMTSMFFVWWSTQEIFSWTESSQSAQTPTWVPIFSARLETPQRINVHSEKISQPSSTWQLLMDNLHLHFSTAKYKTRQGIVFLIRNTELVHTLSSNAFL